MIAGTSILVFGLAFFLSAGLTGVIRRYALKSNLMDIPNHRSSHIVPTPRGGGLGIVVAYFFVVVAGALLSRISWWVALIVLGGLPVAMIGFLDDHHSLKISTRIAVHFISALWILLLIGGPPLLDFGSVAFDWGYIGYPFALLAVAWLINLYNFMDGIDGIAGGEAVVIPAIGGAFLAWQGRGDLVWLSAALSVCSLGFLVWNWPPAKIFMGDIGSGFLGFIFSVLALLSATQDPRLAWFWIILLGVFIVDSTITLLRRMARGERWTRPHCSHAFQCAAVRWGHKRTTVTVILIDLFWLAPWAVLSQLKPVLIPVALVVSWAPLACGAWCLGAGKPER